MVTKASTNQVSWGLHSQLTVVLVIPLGLLSLKSYNLLKKLLICFWLFADGEKDIQIPLLRFFPLSCFTSATWAMISTSLSNPPRSPPPPSSDPVSNTKWTICWEQLLQHPSWYFQGSIQEAHNFSRFSCLVENPCPELPSTSNLHTNFFSPKVKLILALTPLTLVDLLLEH